MKQWSPRCTPQIKEIYDNLPVHGNEFLDEGFPRLEKEIKAFHERTGVDRDSFNMHSFSQYFSEKRPFKLELQKEAKKTERISIKNISRKNARKISHNTEERGFSNSKLIETLVLSMISPIEPSIKPSVEIKKEGPSEIPAKIEPPKPISRELEPAKFDMAEWIALRNQACPNCQAIPRKGKDELLHVVCKRPKEWKEGKYGWIGKGVRGKIPIEICQSEQARLIKKELKKAKDRGVKKAVTQPDRDARRTVELEGEIRHLRQRIKELEPFESALFIEKQKRGQRNYIDRLLAFPHDQLFKCWTGTATLKNCELHCGSYEHCKDRLSHEPPIIALAYVENQLRNHKYCPIKDEILSDYCCSFPKECQDREKCQKLRLDPAFLKERIERIIDLCLDAMYPIEPSFVRKWAEKEAQRVEEALEPMEPLELPESLKELPENITYIFPETATMTLEEIEKEGLNGALEDEELDIFDRAVRDTPPLRFAGGKTLEEKPNIAEPPKIEEPSNVESVQEPENPEDPGPRLITHQVKCPRDKTPKLQRECLSCKPWQRALCTEYQKFPQTEEDLAFKMRGRSS